MYKSIWFWLFVATCKFTHDYILPIFVIITADSPAESGWTNHEVYALGRVCRCRSMSVNECSRHNASWSKKMVAVNLKSILQTLSSESIYSVLNIVNNDYDSFFYSLNVWMNHYSPTVHDQGLFSLRSERTDRVNENNPSNVQGCIFVKA